jgi:hypothetical protein
MFPYKMSEIQVGRRAALYWSVNSEKRDKHTKILTVSYREKINVQIINSAYKDKFETCE